MRRVAACFDIDGVLVRGKRALPGAAESLRRVQRAGVPFVFVTNGGGHHESVRARQLEKKLCLLEGETPLRIREDHQIVLAHSPMKSLVNGGKGTASQHPLAEKRVMVLGCRDEIAVAKAYGFKKVVSPQQFFAQHPEIYAFRQPPEVLEDEFKSEPVEAILVMHDPVDWHLELQVCIDILLGKDPLSKREEKNNLPQFQTVPVFNSNEDFVYACKYHHPRFAQGAFLHTLGNLFALSSGGTALDVVRFGKPHKVTFDFAERMLKAQVSGNIENQVEFDKIFMVGDNIHADIKGANDAGDPWHSILVETGVYRPGMDDMNAKSKVKSVSEAVDIILASC